MHNKIFIYLIALAPLYAAHATSFATNPTSTKFKSFVATLSAGPAWENAGQTKTFYLNPNIKKTYAANNPNNTIASGELFLGMQRALKPQWAVDLGVAVATITNVSLAGEVWDDANSEFNNSNYTYKVQDTRIAIKGKLLKDLPLHALKSYVSASCGLSFNNASNYQAWPIIEEELPSPNFQDHATTSFTYSIGLGFQRPINKHWQIGVGYEFTDWGNNQLSAAPGQTIGTGLALSHLYTNGLIFSINYLGAQS